MVAPTAMLLLLDGAFTPVPVTAEAFQLPSGTGSVSGSFLIAEHTASVYLVNSLSLPALSRQISSTPLYFDFASSTIRGITPVDGGFYLAPGLEGHRVYVGTADAPTTVSLRFSNDDFGHILPPPAVAGEMVWIEIRASDGDHVAWAGSVLCTSQSSAALPPSLSLKDLRAIVEFEAGAVRTLIPESTISVSISILGLFMAIFYLVVVASQTETILLSQKENTKLILAGDIQSTALRLFFMNGPVNSLSSAIGGLVISDSGIQSFRESVVLVYSLVAFVVCINALFGWKRAPGFRKIRDLPVATVRVVVETCLLASIALPMGVFSKLSQFTSALIVVAIIWIALRDVEKSATIASWPVRLTDLLFRAAAIAILAPTIFFPVFVTSSVEHRDALYLAWPAVVCSVMIAALMAHTRLDRPGLLSLTDFRFEPQVVQCVLFVALTVLVKPIAFPPTI